MSLRAIYDVAAPAKLNLFLHVVGRRPDGYHLIQSAFVLIDWCDTLHLELRGDGRLSRHDLAAKLPDDDLCLRAARLLQRESGTTLGADVPFFLAGRNAWVQGIGERITPIAIAPHRFAVVKPAASIATEAIFTSPELVRNTDAAILAGFLADVGIEGLMQGFGRNDLQPPAMARCDEVAQAARLLEARFGNSRMTGSGSAVFARVSAEEGKGSGAESPPEATWPADLPPGWVGRMCRSLEQHPLAGWASD
jgi:4-diphosphocytidyl-2-C-methyl-D-erythritol kinase